MTSEAAAIDRHLAASAHGYWDPTYEGSAVVTRIRTDDRASGSLYWYRVELGNTAHQVVVKRFDPSRLDPTRFRLSGLADASGQFELEFRALQRIGDHFESLDDPGLGFPPILDRIPGSGALVIERVHGTPLNRLFATQHRLRPGRRHGPLLDAVRRTGAWLREFHSVAVETAVTHRATRDEFLDLIDHHVSYLAQRGRSPTFLGAVRDSARSAAEAVLPYDLPLAVAHSDFAMRNVLVQQHGRVVVIDTLARRRAPIYEDLATFVIGARSVKPQMYSRGLAFSRSLLDAVERSLLLGYGGESPGLSNQLAAYEPLLVLDRWVAMAAAGSASSRAAAPARVMAERHFKDELRRVTAPLA